MQRRVSGTCGIPEAALLLRIPLKAFQSNLIKKTSVAKCMFRCILFGVALLAASRLVYKLTNIANCGHEPF